MTGDNTPCKMCPVAQRPNCLLVGRWCLPTVRRPSPVCRLPLRTAPQAKHGPPCSVFFVLVLGLCSFFLFWFFSSLVPADAPDNADSLSDPPGVVCSFACFSAEAPAICIPIAMRHALCQNGLEHLRRHHHRRRLRSCALLSWSIANARWGHRRRGHGLSSARLAPCCITPTAHRTDRP